MGKSPGHSAARFGRLQREKLVEPSPGVSWRCEMDRPRRTRILADVLRRESVIPLLVTAAVANAVCLLIDSAVPAIQSGQLSCLGLWLGLVARGLVIRLMISAVVLAGSYITLGFWANELHGVEVVTLLAIGVVAVWLTARGLRALGVLRTFDTLAEPSSRGFSLREAFVWTTAFAVLACLLRFTELPPAADVWQLVIVIGGGVVLANALAALVAEVTPGLQLLAGVAVLFVVTVAVRGTTGDTWEIIFMFYGIQAAVLLSWINATRFSRTRRMNTSKITVTVDRDLLRHVDDLVRRGCFASRGHFLREAVLDKLDRLGGSRLARESAKLDAAEEKQLAEEGLSADSKTWPQY